MEPIVEKYNYVRFLDWRTNALHLLLKKIERGRAPSLIAEEFDIDDESWYYAVLGTEPRKKRIWVRRGNKLYTGSSVVSSLEPKDWIPFPEPIDGIYLIAEPSFMLTTENWDSWYHPVTKEFRCLVKYISVDVLEWYIQNTRTIRQVNNQSMKRGLIRYRRWDLVAYLEALKVPSSRLLHRGWRRKFHITRSEIDDILFCTSTMTVEEYYVIFELLCTYQAVDVFFVAMSNSLHSFLRRRFWVEIPGRDGDINNIIGTIVDVAYRSTNHFQIVRAIVLYPNKERLLDLPLPVEPSTLLEMIGASVETRTGGYTKACRKF